MKKIQCVMVEDELYDFILQMSEGLGKSIEEIAGEILWKGYESFIEYVADRDVDDFLYGSGVLGFTRNVIRNSDKTQN